MQTPFLSLGYLELCQRAGSDVRICVINDGNCELGYFPFELSAPGVARPLGYYFNDYQGVVGRTDLSFDLCSMMRACGLSEVRLDHMLHANRFLTKRRVRDDVSWLVELHSGYSEYRRSLTSAQQQKTKKIERKAQRMRAAFGEFNFIADFKSEDMLQTLMEWKSAQWARSGWIGRFEADWEKKLMNDLMCQSTRDFSGVLTGLFLGDETLALHLGLASFNTWHYWTTAYNKRYEKYSPGLIMLNEMLKAASSLTYTQIDLGKGDMRYKRDVSNAIRRVSEVVLTFEI